MLSLVVPTYNERHNLPTLLERLEAALANCGEPFEVIVVDDDSPDGTSPAARSLQPRFPWLRVSPASTSATCLPRCWPAGLKGAATFWE